MATLSPVRNERGEVNHYVLIARDMTHELALERKLHRAERLATIGQTVAGAAHYMKNIISGLKGSYCLIDHQLAKNRQPAIEEMWGVLRRNLNRMAGLVEDMLTYARPHKPELAPESINAIAREVCQDCAAMAAARKIMLLFEPLAGLPDVQCERETIIDAIMNLVGNAIEACEEIGGGTIHVQTDQDPNTRQALVVIRDDGPGIPAELLPCIFDPFFTTKGSKGSGLGLAVAQKAVVEHGGQIEVQSRPGQTAFTIRLPI